MGKVFEVTQKDLAVRLPPHGSCLYCGATTYRPGENLKLAAEHIIPEGLGGTVILPKASCESCAKITSLLERSVLKGPLYAIRVHQQIRRKRKKRPPEKFQIIIIKDEKEEIIELSLDEHPVILNMFGLGPPGILAGHDGTDRSGQFIFSLPLNCTPEEIAKSKYPSFQLPFGNLHHFWRFLGKIAHGFFIQEYGSGNFKPLLPDFILTDSDRPEHYFYLVGCEKNKFPQTKNIHQITLEEREVEGAHYIVVLIRLFAYLETPTFCVVAGKAN